MFCNNLGILNLQFLFPNFISMKYFLAVVVALCTFQANAQSKKYPIATGLYATVNHKEGSKSVQVLMQGVETIELDLSQSPNNTFLIKTSDYNFDGYKDFAFTSKDAAPGAPTIYDIFLYHPTEKSFEALEVPEGACEVFANVRVNVADKTIRASCRTGTKASLDVYGWTDAFTLDLVKSNDNGADAQADKADEKADRKASKLEELRDKREQIKEQKEEKEESDD